MAQFKLSHVMAGFVLFAVLVGTMVVSYGGLSEEYGFTRNDTRSGYDVMQKLDNMNIVSGINSTTTGITTTFEPNNPLDIIGGLMAIGIGFMQSVVGVLTFPAEIISIVGDFYYIPSALTGAVVVIFYVYLTFVIINVLTKGDN